MSTQALPLYFDARERIGGSLLLSLILHSLLFVAAVGYAALGPHIGGWGNPGHGGSATRIGSVASLPGVPLPAPLAATQNVVAPQNTGLYQTEPTPKVEPPKEVQEIPKFKESVKPEKAERIAKRLQKEQPVIPENAVPYGLGGKPAMNYAPVVNSAGEGGIRFGEGGDFGEMYGWYVTAVRNRIGANWLLSTISPNILSAPRVDLTFEIRRDGSIENIQTVQSSGIPEVDRSALRAVLASNPLPALPTGYSGSSVKVDLFFDFHRR